LLFIITKGWLLIPVKKDFIADPYLYFTIVFSLYFRHNVLFIIKNVTVLLAEICSSKFEKKASNRFTRKYFYWYHTHWLTNDCYTRSRYLQSFARVRVRYAWIAVRVSGYCNECVHSEYVVQLCTTQYIHEELSGSCTNRSYTDREILTVTSRSRIFKRVNKSRITRILTGRTGSTRCRWRNREHPIWRWWQEKRVPVESVWLVDCTSGTSIWNMVSPVHGKIKSIRSGVRVDWERSVVEFIYWERSAVNGNARSQHDVNMSARATKSYKCDFDIEDLDCLLSFALEFIHQPVGVR